MGKPPEGLKPRYLHDEQRYLDVCSAIARYYNSSSRIPIDWVEEYNELIGRGIGKRVQAAKAARSSLDNREWSDGCG